MSERAASFAISRGKVTISSIVASQTDCDVDKSPIVGGIPGVTKRVAATKVHSKPDIYMYDTPGIFLPSIDDPEVGLKMALCGRILNWLLTKAL